MASDLLLVLIGHTLCIASFSALFILVAIGRRHSPYRAAVLVASAGTVLWAAMTMSAAVLTGRPAIIPLAEWIGMAGWTWLTLRLLSTAAPERKSLYQRLGYTALSLSAIAIAALSAIRVAAGTAATVKLIGTLEATALIGLVIFSLALLETLARWMSQKGRRAATHYLLAIGTLLTINLFVYATTLLLGRVDGVIYEARGLILALAPPLIAIALTRERDWLVDLHVSRDAIVSAATLISAGLYLLAMATAGFALRELNATWGPVLQVTFLAGAVIVLISFISSDAFRPRLGQLVSRHFFSAKYDYRQEWVRFSNALAVDPAGSSVEQRLLDAILQALACRSGALWLYLEGHKDLVLAAAQPTQVLLQDATMSDVAERVLAADEPLRLSATAASALATATKLRNPRIAAPLRHRTQPIGIILLADPITFGFPEPEDCEFLKVLCIQASGHLAEQRLATDMSRTKRFEATARQLTYIGHDLKNIVSQLSMVTQNWSRHSTNAAFIDELPVVLSGAVERMQRLLQNLKSPFNRESGDQYVNVGDCINALQPAWRARCDKLQCEWHGTPVYVRGTREYLDSVFDQLVANAAEASDGIRPVSVSSRNEGDRLIFEVANTGACINERKLVASHFDGQDSQKANGHGIGLFQIRDYVRRLEGTITFASTPESGTTVRVSLPIATPAVPSPSLQSAIIGAPRSAQVASAPRQTPPPRIEAAAP